MSPRIDGVNRAVLALLGLLLAGTGVLGLLLGFGVFGAARADSPVLPQPARTFAAEQPWFWWAIVAGCLLLALLAGRWLLAQLRTDRVGRLDLTTDAREGVTTVHAGALTDAVDAEAGAVRGVGAASAHLRDRRGRRLQLTVDLTSHADLGEVRRALEDGAVAHARDALDDPTLPVDLELRPGRARSGDHALL